MDRLQEGIQYGTPLLDTFVLGIAGNIGRALVNSMKNWKRKLKSGEDFLGRVNVKRYIFQGDTLSQLLFVLSFISLSLVLCNVNPFVPNAPFLYPLKTSENRKVKVCYNLSKNRSFADLLLLMYNLKLFAKNEK